MVKGKKILIVDDDERNIFALTMVLQSMGALCSSATNGQEGIDALNKTPDFDYVLMDMMMPVMDGFEAIRQIKQIKSLKHIPIVAVTANAMKGDKEKCLEAGADGYLSKPVDTNLLIKLLGGL